MDAPVLLTGATGYIGGRLLQHFEEAGRPVRCLARNPQRVRATRSTTEVVQGDCLEEESLELALATVDVAYYLVHSMSIDADFAEVTRRLARSVARRDDWNAHPLAANTEATTTAETRIPSSFPMGESR